jgi:hypothetical protein
MKSNNRDRGVDLLVLGAAGILGFLFVKALTTPSNRQHSVGNRQLALPNPCHFVVLYSKHGSGFRFDTPTNELPAAPHKTWDEACGAAQRFETTADAINGRACVMDVYTGERFSPYPAAAQL